MTKELFIRQLKKSLRGVSSPDQQEIMADYEEHFRIGTAEGKTEDTIADSLGNPKTIGKSYRIDAMLEDSGNGASAKNVISAVFASISLGFFNLIFILGPFIALMAVLISLWAAALSLGLGGIAVLFGLILQPVLPEVLSVEGLNLGLLIFGGIGSTSLGFLAVLGMWQLSKFFTRGTGKYLKFNANFIRKSKENNND